MRYLGTSHGVKLNGTLIGASGSGEGEEMPSPGVIKAQMQYSSSMAHWRGAGFLLTVASNNR